MQADPTLDVNLTRALEESKRLAESIKPGSDRWDVIVVGSGAAGGMAAFQLRWPVSRCCCSKPAA